MIGAEAAFSAIAHPVRRQILDLLREEGTLKAGEIASQFREHSRPGISRHLRVLRDAKLVLLEESEDGREQPYALNAEPLQEVHQWLDFYQDFWRGKLDDLKEIIEGKEY